MPPGALHPGSQPPCVRGEPYAWIYISLSTVHVASGVHHCTAEYIYRARGGDCDPVPTGQFAHQCPPMPTVPLGGPRRRHLPPVPPPNRLISPPLPPDPPTMPANTPRGTVPASEPPRGLVPRAPLPPSTVHRPARRSGQLPRRANWRPMPPLPGARSTAGGPLAPGLGD